MIFCKINIEFNCDAQIYIKKYQKMYVLRHATKGHRGEGTHKCGELVSKATLNFCAGVPILISP